MKNLSRDISLTDKIFAGIWIFFFAITLFYPLFGLGYAYYHDGKKPFNFNNSKWTCETRNMWFFTTESNADGCRGKFLVDGEIRELYFKSLAGNRGAICTIDSPARFREDYLWSGDVKYRTNQFTLRNIDEGMPDVLFEEDDFPIIFIREALSSEEVERLKEQFSE